jgi:hypothetical protein
MDYVLIGTIYFWLFSGFVLAVAVALLVGGLLVVAFFTAAVELVIDDVSVRHLRTVYMCAFHVHTRTQH